MKTLLTFLSILFIYVSSVKGQEVEITDSLFQTPEEQFNFIVENLDLTSITSGLLADKTLPLISYQNYDGLHLADSNMASAFNFRKMYGTISGMAIDSSHYLPHPSSYTDTLAVKSADEIYIGGLNYEYHQFKSYALDSNLITTDSVQLYDVISPSENPYEKKRAFLIAPMQLSSTSLFNDFIFNSELFYTNSNANIDSILIDFGDGRGFIKVLMDSVFSVAYDSVGVKTIITTIYFDNSSNFTSHAQFLLREGFSSSRNYDFGEAELVTIYADSAFVVNGIPEIGAAFVTTILACGHEKLVKPLIWVEGFNSKPLITVDSSYNLDPGYMQNILTYTTENIGYKTLLSYCDEEGYDLIYIDFEDGGDWIQKNAYVVQKVINWVNDLKAQNGSTEQNVVIGESMGGLVAKYALRKMEIDNIDHQTKTYMSLDTPHQGANIPLCVQFAAKHLPYISVGGNPLWEYIDQNSVTGPLELPDLRTGEFMLNTPAARQMLIYRAPDDFNNQTGTDLHGQEHEDFYNEYNGLGELQHCETLMSTNGSPNGLSGGQAFGPGEELIKFKFNNGILHNLWMANINNEVTDVNQAIAQGAQSLGASVVWLIGSVFAQGFVNFRLNALPDYSSSNERIYKGHISTHFIGIPVGSVYTHKVVKVKEVYPLDSSPGGVYSLDAGEELDIANVPPFVQMALDNENIVVKSNGFDFIPLFSGLDLPSSYSTDPYSSVSSLATANDSSSAFRTVLSDSIFFGEDFFGEIDTLNNSAHINFYQSNAKWFLFHLIGNDGINDNTTWTSGSFNFGDGNLGTGNYTNMDHRRTTSKIDNLTSITGTGQVYINKANKIGHITVDNGPFAVAGTSGNPTNFIVTLKPECTEFVQDLTVENGGLL